MSLPTTADKEIDTSGLNCPLPILRAKKALAEMTSGQVLKIIATDPGSMRDFQAFAKQSGNELLGQEAVGKEFLGPIFPQGPRNRLTPVSLASDDQQALPCLPHLRGKQRNRSRDGFFAQLVEVDPHRLALTCP